MIDALRRTHDPAGRIPSREAVRTATLALVPRDAGMYRLPQFEAFFACRAMAPSRFWRSFWVCRQKILSNYTNLCGADEPLIQPSSSSPGAGFRQGRVRVVCCSKTPPQVTAGAFLFPGQGAVKLWRTVYTGLACRPAPPCQTKGNRRKRRPSSSGEILSWEIWVSRHLIEPRNINRADRVPPTLKGKPNG